MTKAELLREYNRLCDEQHMTLDGIYSNCRKGEIQNAIDCLNCTDDQLADYMTVIKLKYPNIYRTIASNGDYKRHKHNRLYVYNTARLALGLTT